MDEQGFSPEIQKHIDALLPVAREFVMGPELGKVVQVIGSKNQLHIDQVGALEAEVFSALIGITETEEFAENVAGALNLDEQKSQAITKDVNDLIFLKIRQGMMSSSSQPKAPEPIKAPLATQIPVPAPSIVPTPTISQPKPAPVPTPPAPAPAPISAPKPVAAPNLMAAEAMLSEKKVAAPAPAPKPAAPTTPAASPISKVDPAQPQNYKADPYREPVE